MRIVSKTRLINQNLIFAKLVSFRDSFASCTLGLLRPPYAGDTNAARFLAGFLGSPCTHVTSERWLSDAFLEQEEFPGLADLVSLMLDSLTQPARLPPLGEAGDEVGTHLLRRDIAVNVRLAVQDNDILMDEDAGT